ncbi:acetate kinase [Spiroplasma platyhelix]|uniref:Acetate kinase n=1 Tax=Spiroplasma platyhelix PALS-1 TaxID=1276218 RepID=A0A846UE58_9MOLU|nr:acetate kinase [Spiroplasma platyhelix]MBE4704396.1 Acetate kinase [Spiroplasma platyhelix PALS-1]NKE38768.1 acetate kinase [Spiroplasma platyhelix PALS-1]UJB28979.1 acetate kinase [Spiroplasma platyhelix PALS-1]
MSDKILVINAGSSSIKFQLFNILSSKPEFQILAKGLVERIGIKDSRVSIELIQNNSFIKYDKQIDVQDHAFGAKLIIEQLQLYSVISNFDEIVGIGHRLVHGGEKFKTSTIINQAAENAIIKSVSLAPLHNPAALKGYNAFKALNPKIKHVAVFDTSFHMTLPEEKYLYSTPYQWYQKYQVRKYGFHGISYRYILEKLAAILKKDEKKINAVVCHLGNGASICAIKDGQSFNTTMGLTPLDGLIMGTRSGVVDPSIHQYICEITKNTSDAQTIASVTDILNKESGLLGISGVSSDIRDVTAAKEDENHPKHHLASLAIKMFCQRIANYIIQYSNDLDNKVDALVFTAGIGENGVLIRKWVLEEIKILSLKLNSKANEEKYDDYVLISDLSSVFPIYKIRTNEEIIICHDTYELLNKK